MSNSTLYQKRRQAYMETIGEHAVAIVRSPPEQLRNGDVLYPFRQSSDLFYLTGFAEPETTMLLRPGAPEGERFIMFVRPRDRERETWDGKRSGVEGAVSEFGADQAHPTNELPQHLPELIANSDDVYYSLGLNRAFDMQLVDAIVALRSRERRGKRAPLRIVDPRATLHEMRLRKSAAEIQTMRTAAAITARAHLAAMQLAAPGVMEYELEAIINYEFRKSGGSGPGYSTIVGAGDNATILHYIENNCRVTETDLILIDAGCEYNHYTADVTRTFPASGTFSSAQRDMYSWVLRAQQEAVAMTAPGTSIDDLHKHCVKVLTTGMVELGLLEGPVEDRIEDETYKKYYVHSTSHWLGIDVHDSGAYRVDGAARPLEPGMVITIEPGLYVARDNASDDCPFAGLGIRIEDDVLVVEGGHENLTEAIPKSIEAIEAACRSQ